MVDKDKIESGKVYRNKKTGEIGVPSTGYDYGCTDTDIEVAMIYQGRDGNPQDEAPPSLGTSFGDLEEYELKSEDLLTEEHMKKVCKPGSGEATCRYLSVGRNGFECEKVSPNHSLAFELDDKVEEGTMNAKGNNCGGRYSAKVFQNSKS